MLKTAHAADCKRVFKNYDINCSRCQELIKGAKPRAGWNDLKIRNEQQRSISIENHYKNHATTCEYAIRNVPCVAFDY